MARLLTFLMLALLAGAMAWGLSSKRPGPGMEPVHEAWRSDVASVLETYCVGCHSGEEPTGDLDLAPYASSPVAPHAQALVADGETWEAIFDKVRMGVMPPPGEDRPDPEAVAAFTAWGRDTLPRTPGA